MADFGKLFRRRIFQNGAIVPIVPAEVEEQLRRYRQQSYLAESKDEIKRRLSSLTAPQLKNLCRDHRLLVGGKKAELLERLLDLDAKTRAKTKHNDVSMALFDMFFPSEENLGNPERPKEKKKKAPAARKKKRARADDDDGEEGTEKKLKPKRMQVKTVEKLLEKHGIKWSNYCLCAGIQRGHVVLDDKNPLETVVFKAPCEGCGEEVVATVDDLRYQHDCGFDYEDGAEGGGFICKKEDCGWRQYVTGICEGKMELDSGKMHNHCTDCRGFGKCIGDYRTHHCKDCGKHYYAGLMGYPCSCQEQEDDMEEFMFW